MKTPRPHQQQAIDSIDTSLDRQQIIMACGTGKTLTGMFIAQRFVHGRATIVVTVPTLGLLEQTYRAWREDAPFEFSALAVCSQDIGGVTSEDISLDELSVESTTDAQRVAHFVESATDVRVIFATYQSTPVLSEAQRKYSVSEFDLAIVDEAHRTAGDSQSKFSSILTDTSIRVSKRVFMTATPKVVSSKSDDVSRVVLSMDDESVYGPRRYELSVREAVNAGLLSDFKLLVVGVTDAEVDRYFEEYGEAAENIAAAAALTRAIEDYSLSSSLVYFNTIVASDAFARTMQRVAGDDVECYHVDGTIPLADRLRVLDKIETSEKTTVISNSRCLSEGIDVPTLDSVMFADARSSDVDIVQCIGRAIRKNPNGDKEAKIILNVRVHENEDVDQIIDSSEFKKIRQIISGLESHDSELAVALRDFPRGENRQRDYLDDWIEYRLPNEIEDRVFGSFKSNLAVVALDSKQNSNEQWMEIYSLVKEFSIQFGRTPKREECNGVKIGLWVHNQRNLYQRECLSEERKLLLESIPHWTWSVTENLWMVRFNLTKEFSIKFGRLPTSREEYNGIKIGQWVHVQLSSYKNDELSEERKLLLESIPHWKWNATESAWMVRFNLTKEFSIKFGRLPTSTENYCEVKIGSWTRRQINLNTIGKLSEERKLLLESIPHWKWGIARNQQWRNSFNLVKEFSIEFDRLPKGKEEYRGVKIGQWMVDQRRLNKKGNLSKERKFLMESIPGWYW